MGKSVKPGYFSLLGGNVQGITRVDPEERPIIPRSKESTALSLFFLGELPIEEASQKDSHSYRLLPWVNLGVCKCIISPGAPGHAMGE